MRRLGRVIVALVVALVATPGCALLSKSAPLVPRHFDPEVTGPPGTTAAQPSGLELRLGRVTGQEYLRDKIVHRDSPFEVGYYDGRVWTEKPAIYVRRAILHAVFDERGVREVVSGAAPTLDVEVIAFEEVMKPAHVGRVELAYVLYDDRVVLASRSLKVERPIAPATGDAAATAAVSAIAAALSGAVESVAEAAVAELRTQSTTSAQAP
jgi:cholesterol transport system auxiliary component